MYFVVLSYFDSIFQSLLDNSLQDVLSTLWQTKEKGTSYSLELKFSIINYENFSVFFF